MIAKKDSSRRWGPLAILGAFTISLIPGLAREGPMPVPEEVAISRPSPEEIAQAKKDLDQLLEQAEPDFKTVLEEFPDLVVIQPPRPNPCIRPSLNPRFRGKHADNVAVAKKGDIDVLFMGDSITDWWRRAGAPDDPNPPSAGKAVFDEHFGDLKVANFGIAGDTTQGVLYRLLHGEGEGFEPEAIMLMIGTNNAPSATPEEIAEGVGAVVLKLRDSFPEAKILLLGIFPRGEPDGVLRRTVMAVNPIISKLHDGEHVFYLDIGDKFLAEDGTIPKDLMADGLHPTHKGYEIWAEAVEKPLAELMD